MRIGAFGSSKIILKSIIFALDILTSGDAGRYAQLNAMNENNKRLVERIFGASEFLLPFVDRPWYPFFRNGVFIFAFLFLGAASALVILEPWTTPAQPVNKIQIGRLEVPTGNARPEELINLSRARLQTPLTLTGPDFVHRTNWISLGASVDLQTLDRILLELAQEDSPAARYARDKAVADELLQIPMPISLDSQAAVESLVALKEMVDRKPKNASFDFEAQKVIKEASGLSLDVYATLARLDQALKEGLQEVSMAVTEVPAHIAERNLADIDVNAVAGFFETRYSRMRKDKDRTHNVKLGASLLDGQVILPGQFFSFNDTLGVRSEARGFRYAPVIAGGVLVEGMGGGTCQVASTLNAAAFFSGLVVVDRRPHSRPSSYIKLGLDATVSYPDINLKLKNPFDFPVVIHFTMNEGMLRAEFRGKSRPFTVTFLRKVIGTKPFPVRIVDDSHLQRGKEVITQNGIPGYSVRRYQIIEKEKVAYRFQTVDKYPPTSQFVHRGVAEPDSLKGNEQDDAPKPDTHKPYRASTYLRMVQGKDDLWYQQSHE